MDAIGMLEKEHQGAKKVMEDIAKSPVSEKKKLFESLKLELEAHDRVEEQVFYPAVQSNPKTSSLPAQDKKAHEAVEKALEQLSKLPVEDKDWARNFKAMQEMLLKHVSDEETNFFVKVRAVLSATELNTLGTEMAAYKDKNLKAAR